MDLNYLLYREQIALMRADAATCISSRHSHQGMARGYADRIRSLQLALGAGILAETAF